MSAPVPVPAAIVQVDDLAIYLNDDGINTERAQAMLDRAHAACSSIVSPLPVAAAFVVERVAGRGYLTTMSSRARQQQDAGSPYGAMTGGIWLSRDDKADLRRVSGGGGVASVDMLPAGYVAPVRPYTGWATTDEYDA